MPTNAKINLTSLAQGGFPEGTVPGPWRIKLVDGPAPRQLDVSDLPPSVTFDNVQPGTYRATLQRYSATGQPLGAETSSAQFVVNADVTVTVEVAGPITVELIKVQV